MHGVYLPTQNPFELRYARQECFPWLPKCRLIFISRARPVTEAEVEAVAGCLLEPGYKLVPSRIELTFDLSRYPISLLARQVVTRARRFCHVQDIEGRQTWYFGRPRSSWELTIYQKVESVVRFEFALRRAFFRKQGYSQLSDIRRLADFNFWEMACLREIDAARLRLALKRFPETWKKDTLLHWPLSLSELALLLRKAWRVDPATVLRMSRAEASLRSMQKNLVW